MKKNHCLFCKIVQREIPAYIVYENKQTLAFLDVFPVDYGHVLIISKRCIPNLLELTPEESQEIYHTAQQVTKLLWNKFQPKGFNFVNNFNAIAGQVINHYHIHVIPKYEKERGWYGAIKKPPLQITLEKVWEKLK